MYGQQEIGYGIATHLDAPFNVPKGRQLPLLTASATGSFFLALNPLSGVRFVSSPSVMTGTVVVGPGKFMVLERVRRLEVVQLGCPCLEVECVCFDDAFDVIVNYMHEELHICAHTCWDPCYPEYILALIPRMSYKGAYKVNSEYKSTQILLLKGVEYSIFYKEVKRRYVEHRKGCSPNSSAADQLHRYIRGSSSEFVRQTQVFL